MTNFSSFRDPDGYIIQKGSDVYRIVNLSYKNEYDMLMKTGLYDRLINDRLLISHKEVLLNDYKDAYKVLKPETIPYISYPYEWCFSQLKDAALLTLKIQKKSLEHKMSLKDASAYNVQFLNGQPIFIDTLSFEKWDGGPWVAYGQFCRHFIAPLALMAYKDVRLNQLLRIYIDGIPLDLVSSLLPLRTHFNLWLNVHVHWQSKLQGVKTKTNKLKTQINLTSLLGIIDSLETCIKALKWEPKGQWMDYLHDNNYSQEAMQHKKVIVQMFLNKLNSRMIWDLGGNIGEFSRLSNHMTVCFDIDASCVELNYCKHDRNILPLVMDLTNPSSSIGWDNKERMSFERRGKADVIMALALIHHLAISNNVSFGMIANFMAQFCKNLIIEFIPKSDSQIQRITSRDIDFYTQDNFEREFGCYFHIKTKIQINDSERWIYLMERKIA